MLGRTKSKYSRLAAFGVAACLTGVLATMAGIAQAKDNAGAWLLEPVGARAMALQAYTPVADDASATTLSPAGLGKSKRTEVLFYTRESTLGIGENFLGIVVANLGPGALGVSWRHASVQDSDDAPFQRVDASGNVTGSLGYRGNAFDVGYGAPINESLQVGASLGIVMDAFDNIEGTTFSDDETASGFGGITLGVTGTAAQVLEYGVALRNLGGSLGEDGSIPVALSAGTAVRFPRATPVIVAFEIEKLFVDLGESTTQVRMGTEYRLDPIALRLGTSQSADRSRWFAGFGVAVASVQMDYAFQFINRAPYGLDAPRHFVSLSYLY